MRAGAWDAAHPHLRDAVRLGTKGLEICWCTALLAAASRRATIGEPSCGAEPRDPFCSCGARCFVQRLAESIIGKFTGGSQHSGNPETMAWPPREFSRCPGVERSAATVHSCASGHPALPRSGAPFEILRRSARREGFASYRDSSAVACGQRVPASLSAFSATGPSVRS